MSELNLEPLQRRPYGWRAHGVVETEDHAIPVTMRLPPDQDSVSNIHVLATGLCAAKASMRVPALVAVEAGQAALSFDYTNKGREKALERNVDDFVAVTDSLPKARFSTLDVEGISMGGAVVTMALDRLQRKPRSATVIAPGMFIDIPPEGKKQEIAKRFGMEALEFWDMWLHPKQALYLGVTSTANCARRFSGVVGEVTDLTSGTVHDHARAVAATPWKPLSRFVYLLGDLLIPAEHQKEAAEMLEFDQIWPHPGGHTSFARHPGLMRRILQDNAEMFEGERLDIAA